jgi:ketosteroid isomerase-like protein
MHLDCAQAAAFFGACRAVRESLGADSGRSRVSENHWSKDFRMQRSKWLVGTGLILTLAAASLVSVSSRAAHAGAQDPLVAMFVWWNAAYKQKDGFTAESFSRYFTQDAVMRINGKDRCRGLDDLARHFRDIQARTEMVVIDLPFLDEFTSANGDFIFTHHFVRAREHGKDSRERVMGYAAIKDGKISMINFVSVPDPLSEESESKK